MEHILPQMMQNQVEQNMENEMETEAAKTLYGVVPYIVGTPKIDPVYYNPSFKGCQKLGPPILGNPKPNKPVYTCLTSVSPLCSI